MTLHRVAFAPALWTGGALGLLVLAACHPACGAENLLQNPGFEATGRAADQPPGWNTENWGRPQAKNLYTVDAEVAHQGGHAARIVVNEPGGVGTWHQWFRRPDAHRSYSVRAWVKSDAAAAASGIICDGGTILGQRPAARTEGTHDWRLLEIHGIRVKPGNRWLLVSLVCRGGRMWFDDVELLAEPCVPPAPETIVAYPIPSSDGKTAEFVEVHTEHAEFCIARRGGKIVSWWDRQSGRELIRFEPGIALSGAGKDSPPDVRDARLWDGPFDLRIQRQAGSVTVSAQQAPVPGEQAGLVAGRVFTFAPRSTAVDVQHTLSTTSPKFAFTPRIHNMMNVGKSPEGRWRVYCGTREGLRVYPLSFLLPRDNWIEGDCEPWIGLADAEGNAFAAAWTTQVACRRAFVYSERQFTTLEWFYPPVEITPQKPWQVSYRLMTAHGLPSLGHVSAEAIFSLPSDRVAVASPAPRSGATFALRAAEGEGWQIGPLNLTAGTAVDVPKSDWKKLVPLPAGRQDLAVVEGLFRPVTTYPEPLTPDAPPQSTLPPIAILDPPSLGPEQLVYFYCGNHTNELFLSSDLPCFVPLGQFTTLTKAASPKPEPRLMLDLPVEIKIAGGRCHRVVRTEPLERDGRPYIRHQVVVTWSPYNNAYGNSNLIVTVEPSSPKQGRIYFHAEWNGGVQAEQALPFTLVQVSKPGPLKRLFCWFDTFGSLLAQYPDYSHLRQIGFNAVAGLECDAPTYRVVAEKARQAGLDAMLWNSLCRLPNLPEDARARDASGKPLVMLCPTYRGPVLERAFRKGAEMLQAGITIHSFDPERGDGAAICFCPRCLDQFQAFLDRQQPPLPRFDPRKGLGESSQRETWLRFKTRAFADLYQMYRRKMEEAADALGIRDRFRMHLYAVGGMHLAPAGERLVDFPTIESSLEDPRLLATVFDVYAPMIYIGTNGRHGRIDMAELGREIQAEQRYAGPKLRIAPALDPGYVYCGRLNSDVPPVAMRYQLLETLASGAKGAGIYSEGMLDAMDMKYWAEGVRRVLPVEEILLSGDPIAGNRLADVKQQTLVKGVARGDEAVILVSEYSERPRTAEVRYDVGRPSAVIDLETGETLATVSPEKATFRVELRGDRARLFHVKPAGGAR